MVLTGTQNSTLLGTTDDGGAGMSLEMAKLRETWVAQQMAARPHLKRYGER